MEKYEFIAVENGMNYKLFVKKNFLAETQCDELIKYYNDFADDSKATGIGYFDNRLIWYTRIPHSAPAKAIMKEVRIRTIQLIKEFYQLSHEIYGDSIQLVSWPEGLGMPAHYDNRHPNKEEAHPTPWREYAGVVYLNNDYTGGELFMCSANPCLVFKPEKGMLIVFGCGDGFMHGVHPAYGNTRYTMPCWFTYDKTKKESDLPT